MAISLGIYPTFSDKPRCSFRLGQKTGPLGCGMKMFFVVLYASEKFWSNLEQWKNVRRIWVSGTRMSVFCTTSTQGRRSPWRRQTFPGPSKQARSTSISARILPSEWKCVISVPEYPEFSWNYMELYGIIWNYMELYGIIRPKIFETKDRCVWKLLVNKKNLVHFTMQKWKSDEIRHFLFAFVSSECSDKEVEPAKSPTRVNILQQWSP